MRFSDSAAGAEAEENTKSSGKWKVADSGPGSQGSVRFVMQAWDFDGITVKDYKRSKDRCLDIGVRRLYCLCKMKLPGGYCIPCTKMTMP